MQAQLLVIPATTGPEACVQGGWSEIDAGPSTAMPTQSEYSAEFSRATLFDIQSLTGDDSLTSATVYMAIQKSGVRTALQETNLGTATQGTDISRQTVNFSNLEKNTRYVVILYLTLDNPFYRHCFKTRGEFTNAEQNLKPDGSRSAGTPSDPFKFNRTGCFAVARTRQDVADCMCNGTRGGTRVLAGQTTGSQTARKHWKCPDISS